MIFWIFVGTSIETARYSWKAVKRNVREGCESRSRKGDSFISHQLEANEKN